MKAKFIILITSMLNVITGTLHAAPRSSSNYSVITDVVDGGGKRTSSAAFVNDASVSGIIGISTAASPVVAVKAGYIGQLYDVTGFAVTAHAPGMNETGSLQLDPFYVLDDATHLAIAPALVTWSVEAGPITVTTDGIALADIVYQDTPATARGTLGAFSGLFDMSIYDGAPDNYGSYAGDELDDSWQFQYFGLDNPLAGALLDPDGDGQNNRFEFIAGLNPQDPASVFKLRIEKAPGPSNDKKLIFSPRHDDRTYQVWFRPNLATPPLWDVLGGTTQIDIGDERTVTDPNPIDTTRFYRVEITRP